MAALPDLVQIHQRLKEHGVVFISLSPESPADAVALEGVLDSQPDMTWPVGYGAQPTLQALEIFQLPTYVVYDRAGRQVWSGNSHAGLEEELVQLLAN